MLSHLFGGVIFYGLLLLGDPGAMAFTTTPFPQSAFVDLRENASFREIELIVDANGVAQVMTDKERFSHGLDDLNQRVAHRKTRAIELDVTDMFRPFLPRSVRIGEAIDGFESLGLHPTRDKGASHIYFTYFSVPYDRLAAEGRTHFLPGDKLIISYTTASPELDAEITELKVALLNDSFL
jgi:hypothetical protein